MSEPSLAVAAEPALVEAKRQAGGRGTATTGEHAAPLTASSANPLHRQS
jgi:hypothetical protein